MKSEVASANMAFTTMKSLALITKIAALPFRRFAKIPGRNQIDRCFSHNSRILSEWDILDDTNDAENKTFQRDLRRRAQQLRNMYRKNLTTDSKQKLF